MMDGATSAGAAAPAAASRDAPAWRVSWPLLVAVAVSVIFIRRGESLLRDGDTGWHVAAGRWILAHARVPAQDPFSHTLAGAPWTAQEWLSQVVFALAHAAGGWTAVAALPAFACGAAMALLARALLRWLEPLHVLLLVTMATLMTAGHVLARPHMLALPLLVIWADALVRAAETGRAPRWWLLPLMTLWANLHGGFTFGLALAAMFALEALLAARERHTVTATVRAWGGFLLLATASALITPNGLQGLVFTWQVLVQDSYALERIGEWRSPNFHGFQPLELWLLAGLAFLMLRGLRLPPVRLVLLLGLLHLALKHLRSTELLAVLAPLLVARPLAAQLRASRRADTSADRWFAALARPAGGGAIVLAGALLAAGTVAAARLAPVQPPASIAPAAALRAARQAGVQGPVLNGYGFGGFLIEQGVPVFIDGRSDMYRDAFIRRYAEALDLQGSGALERLLHEWRIGWTLLAPGTPAVALLDHLPGWRRVYADDDAVVHARTIQEQP